jgi:hypothetical protein
MLIDFLKFILILLGSWSGLSLGCEYRNYRYGHLFVKAFYAHGWYQKIFTFFQLRKNIKEDDIGKLTYIGFTGVVISTIAAFFVIPYTIYKYFSIGYEAAKYPYDLWFLFNAIWGILAMILQGIDSIINHLRHR